MVDLLFVGYIIVLTETDCIVADIYSRLYLDRLKYSDKAREEALSTLGSDLADRATAVYRNMEEMGASKTKKAKRRLSSANSDEDDDLLAEE